MKFHAFKPLTRTIACVAALTFSVCVQAASVEVAGIPFQDRIEIGSSNLQLNGAGVRWRTIFKVYAAGLYVSRKTTTLDEVIAAPGAKRIRLVMLRDLEADQISQLFMRGVTRNLPPLESIRLTQTMQKLAEALSAVQRFAPGDVLTIDYDPKTGTSFHAKGQQRGETIPGPAVFDAAMHIWLGSDPADWKLKDLLLGKTAE